MYPHVGVDASGLATLRATVATVKETLLRGLVPTALTVPAFAIAAPTGPCYALAD
ncbi:RNA polymerase subunit sigma-24, partial [Streptomyces sp. SID6137]|nr:RNA polymerase subunit sigma-24 [Streptomyces sp. SID6137]